MARAGTVFAVVVAVGLAGCTSVKVAQRDGCWVRHSERWMGGSRDEIGPCAPATPDWSDDRLTRLAQECVTRADYRHYLAAIDAWNAGRPAPQRASDETVLKGCMEESTRLMLTENEAMKKRVGELSADRDALRAEDDKARAHLYTSQEKLADYLGEAAKKAQAPAVATANATSDSTGTATTDTAHEDHTSLAAQPAAPGSQRVTVTAAPGTAAPAAAHAPRPSAPRRARAVPVAPACPDVPATATPTAAAAGSAAPATTAE
jgi:hypothetical protein